MAMSVEDFLDLFSNKYRREILRQLSQGDRHAYELAKILDITPRAVSKHLTVLREVGLVDTELQKSSKGPKKEVYRLNKSFVFQISIGQSLFQVNVSDLNADYARAYSQLQLASAGSDDGKENILIEALKLMPRLRKDMDDLEKLQGVLIRRYQGFTRYFSNLLIQLGLTPDEAEVVLKLVEHKGKLTADELLDETARPEKALYDIIQSLQTNGLIRTYSYRHKGGQTVLVQLSVLDPIPDLQEFN